MKREHAIRRTLIAAAAGAVVAAPLLVFAQEYAPLAAIPGTTDARSLGSFLNAAFRLGIVVAGFLAVVLIAYNGLVYMTSGAVGSKSDAIGWIQDVFWGLALILFSVIILRVINPDILNFRLNIEKLAPTKKVSAPIAPTFSDVVQQTADMAEKNRAAYMQSQGINPEGSSAQIFIIPNVEDPSYETATRNRDMFVKTCTDAGKEIQKTGGSVQASRVAETAWTEKRQTATVETYTCYVKTN